MNQSTPEDLAADLAACEAATPGPWERRDTLIGMNKYHASTEIVGRVVRVDDKAIASTPVCNLAAGFVCFEADCDFIPRARTRFPVVVCELIEAREEIDRLRERIAELERKDGE